MAPAKAFTRFCYCPAVHTISRSPDLGFTFANKEVTSEDPEAFPKSVEDPHHRDLDLGEEIYEYICNENEADAKHMKK